MEPIRVLHVVTKMDAAGLETLLMNFYRNIDRRKVQFDFLTHRTEKGFYDNEIQELGGRIYQVPPINPFKHNKYIDSLDNFFSKKSNIYNIVHSHINTYSMYPLRSAQKFDIPVRIAHSHISNVPLDLKTPFRIYTKARLKKYSTHNFACSRVAGEWLYGSNAVSESNFKVINNSIESIKYRYTKEKENKVKKKMKMEGRFVLGHIGRFSSQKNHSFLIDVFKEVHRKKPNAMLMLIGEGELRSEIEKKVNDLNLQKSVIFTGVKSNIPDLIQVLDVFVLPSLYEGLGIVAVEAQAAGISCIVSDRIPVEAFITDKIKSLSLKEDPKVWATQILKTIDQEKRDTHRDIVEAGYDITEQAKELEGFYLSKDINSIS